MNPLLDTIAKAHAEAQRNRRALKGQLDATRQRLLPGQIKSDVRHAAETHVRNAVRETGEQVRAHPVLTVFGLAALLAWIFRKPLLRHGPPALRDGYAWLSGHAVALAERVRTSEAERTDDD